MVEKKQKPDKNELHFDDLQGFPRLIAAFISMIAHLFDIDLTGDNSLAHGKESGLASSFQANNGHSFQDTLKNFNFAKIDFSRAGEAFQSFNKFFEKNGKDPRLLHGIAIAAAETGRDPKLLLAFSKIESNYGSASYGKSAIGGNARGPFQFIGSTWDGALKTYGQECKSDLKKYGIDVDLSKGRALRDNPYVSSYIAAKTLASNDPTKAYMCHFFGTGGAKQVENLINSGRGNSQLAPLMPGAAACNQGIFYKTNGSARTANEVREFIAEHKIGSTYREIDHIIQKHKGNDTLASVHKLPKQEALHPAA
jgi:hypothetical protein